MKDWIRKTSVVVQGRELLIRFPEKESHFSVIENLASLKNISVADQISFVESDPVSDLLSWCFPELEADMIPVLKPVIKVELLQKIAETIQDGLG